MIILNPEEEWLKHKAIAADLLTQGNLAQATIAYEAAVRAAESFGEKDYRLCWTLEAISDTLMQQKLFQKAEPYLKRALEIKLKVLGPFHVKVGVAADNLAKAYYCAKLYSMSEIYAKQCIWIYEQSLGPSHNDLATALINLATLHHIQENYESAEPLYKRALSIRTQNLGAEHPDTVKILNNYSSLLRATHREAEAEHFRSCASGSITGSWKAVVINKEEQLLPTQRDTCLFCGEVYSDKKLNSCKVCGTERGQAT